MKFSVLSLFLLLSLFSGSVFGETYDLNVTRYEARQTLNSILENQRIRTSMGLPVDVTEHQWVKKLVQSYRSGNSGALMPIYSSPFAAMLINSELLDLWMSAFDDNWNIEYQKQVVNVRLDAVFDGLMNLIAYGTVPDSLKESTKQFGKCVARKALRGKDPDKCSLDVSTSTRSVSALKLFWAKLTCPLNLGMPSPCFVRKVFYDAAKPELIKARKNNPVLRKLVEKEFQKQFPPSFRKSFLEMIASKVRDLPKIVSEKLGGALNSVLWGEKTPLVDALAFGELGGPGGADDSKNKSVRVTMKDIAHGLKADLGVSDLFLRKGDEGLKGIGAPLFYAAANRLLVLMGNKRALWDKETDRFVIKEGDKYDFKQPKRPPVFETEVFGGIGVANSDGGPAFSAWDVENYDPEKGLRLYPAEFILGNAAVPSLMTEVGSGGEVVTKAPHETLDDLVDMFSSIGLFLELTQKDKYLSKHLGTTEEVGRNILKPDSPILMPVEGRRLACGLIGTILNNTIFSGGHVKQTTPGDPDGPVGLAIYNKLSFAGRGTARSPVVTLAKIVTEVVKLKQFIKDDPKACPEFNEQMELFDKTIQNGGVVLVATATEQDGGFVEKLLTPQTTNRKFMTSLKAFEAVIESYQVSPVPIIMTGMSQVLGFIDTMWGDGVSPRAVEGGDDPLLPSEGWTIVNFWTRHLDYLKAQEELKHVDWPKWESRVSDLKNLLIKHLESDSGPQMLSYN